MENLEIEVNGQAILAGVFQTYEEAADKTTSSSETVYTWQSGEGGYNRLTSRTTAVDIIGFVVLPNNLPETIELPDDDPEDEDE